MAMLKQEISVDDLSVAEQLLSDHNDTVQQLSQMADTAIKEANKCVNFSPCPAVIYWYTGEFIPMGFIRAGNLAKVMNLK